MKHASFRARNGWILLHCCRPLMSWSLDSSFQGLAIAKILGIIPKTRATLREYTVSYVPSTSIPRAVAESKFSLAADLTPAPFGPRKRERGIGRCARLLGG